MPNRHGLPAPGLQVCSSFSRLQAGAWPVFATQPELLIVTKVASHGIPAGLDPVLDVSPHRDSSSSPRLALSLFAGLRSREATYPYHTHPAGRRNRYPRPRAVTSPLAPAHHAQILSTTDSSWPCLAYKLSYTLLAIRSAVLDAVITDCVHRPPHHHHGVVPASLRTQARGHRQRCRRRRPTIGIVAAPPCTQQLSGDLEPTRLLLCPTIRPRQKAHVHAQVTALLDLSWETTILIPTRPKQQRQQHITGLT